MSMYEFPYPEFVETPYPNGTTTPAGEGSNPVEAVPHSQEAMAESEKRIDANGATPYAIIDETPEQKGAQAQAHQLPPFDDPSLFEGRIWQGQVYPGATPPG